jgi:hypothetical protein
MRLSQILPLSIGSPARKEDKSPRARPPDVEAGLTGEQVHAVSGREDRRPDDPDDPPPGHIDITI